MCSRSVYAALKDPVLEGLKKKKKQKVGRRLEVSLSGRVFAEHDRDPKFGSQYSATPK